MPPLLTIPSEVWLLIIEHVLISQREAPSELSTANRIDINSIQSPDIVFSKINYE